MMKKRTTVRPSTTSRTETVAETTSTHVVGFTCDGCTTTMPVDSPTYEDLLANGCVVCGAPVAASAFTRRETV